MLSLATRLTALLIAFIFLGATAQCATVCVQPQTSPCHHHGDQDHTICAKPMLTAAHVSQAEIPVPTLTVFPFEFALVLCTHEGARELEILSPPPIASLRTTVLLI
jgi:hypothetical protein